MGNSPLDLAYRLLCYTLPIDQQPRHLNHSVHGCSWIALHDFISTHCQDAHLAQVCLAMLIEELALHRDPPIGTTDLRSLIPEHVSVVSLKEVVLEVIRSGSMPADLMTAQSLLRSKGLPSTIPDLASNIFPLTFQLLSVLSAFCAGIPTAENVDLDRFGGMWADLVIRKLLPGLPRTDSPQLPALVQEQAALYLDISRPFLLFNFRAEEYRIYSQLH